MRLLVIGLDPDVLQASSASAKRQVEYYNGWKVDIVVLKLGVASDIELTPNIRVISAGGRSKILAVIRTGLLVSRLARNNVYDVVTAQEPVACGLIGLLALSKKKIKLHLQDHNAFFARSSRLSGVIARYVAKRAVRIRTVSERGARGLLDLGILKSKIDIIPLARDLSSFFSVRHEPEPGHIVCVSRLSPEKGLGTLLKAFKLVQESYPAARLTIVGEGSRRKEYEALATSLNLRELTFAGKQADVRAYLKKAAIYVQPSHFEGWGTAVTEAAAVGCPIVMTDVGLAGEVILDGISGRVVAPGNPEYLAKALLELLNNPERATQLGRAAQEAVRRLPSAEELKDAIRVSLLSTRRKIRLLVLAQAVDLDDPLFGFFHGWLTHASAYFERLLVGALRVGRHALPENIDVYPLRESGSRSKLSAILGLLTLAWSKRRDYEVVFIRGDAVYLALFGWLWALLRKPRVFWYTHTTARSLWFWAAVPWATRVVTAVPESNPLQRAIAIGHHLDLSAFPFNLRSFENRPRVLIFGRMSPVKRVELMLSAVLPLCDSGQISLRLVGAASDDEYQVRLNTLLSKNAEWQASSVPSEQAAKIYSQTDVLINATPASLDKTILEAAASGCVVFASTPGFSRGLPAELAWLRFETGEDLKRAFERYLSLKPVERQQIAEQLRKWVKDQHSMTAHLGRLVEIVESL